MQKRILSIPTLISIIAILALTVACPAAFAAERAETTTYVDGNLNGVSPNTGGTLLFSDDKSKYFRTGLSTIAVPYASISHVELGATKETSHDVPLYKVWELPKLFSGKTKTQLLIVNFRSDAGEDKNMTLELSKAVAPGVLSLIQSRVATDAPSGKTLVASAAPAESSPEPAKLSENESPAPLAEPTAESKKESKNDAKAEAKAEAKRDKDGAFASRPNNPASAWWGDDYWKTKRNVDKWGAKTPATPGNDQR